MDVNHKKGKIAYYDLNREPHQRKSRSELPNKSAVRPTRIQNKPENMFLDEFNDHIAKYDYQVERAEYQNGLYIPKQFPKLKRDALVMEREQSAVDNYDLIRPIIEDEEKYNEYLYYDSGNQHIQKISQDTGVKAPQIARLLAQYFFRGQSQDALFPNYRYCGCNYQPALEVKVDSPKRGRKAKYTEYRNRLPQDEKLIKEFLRKLGQRLFKRFNYTQHFRLYDFYYQSRNVVTENEDDEKSTRRVPLPESDCISFAQYYSYIKQLEKDRTFAWRKNGERLFLKEYESRFGRARDGVYGPSFRYEIDATVEDVYLIFPYFHEQRLSSGRPVTYRVSCAYSGMVAGFHVGIGGPNWQGVMQALYNAFTDKVEFCERYGINIATWQWPCDVPCNELTIDNGVEYPRVNMAQILKESIGIDCINYIAIYHGRGKGGVEGGFEVDKKEVIQFMPGYVDRLPEKGDSHASNFATYTYHDFIRLLIFQTLIRNNEVFKNNIHDQVMSEEGIDSTSLAVWNFGMEHYMNNGRGKRFPKEQLLFALLPSGKAATTSRGIKFKGLHYSCEFAASNNWLTDHKSRAEKTLEVRYLDSDTNQIWYRYEKNVYTAYLNDHSEIYRNRNWFDALHRLELYTKEKAIQKRKEREARAEQLNDTSAQTALAKQRLKDANAPTSKSPQKHVSTMALIEKSMQNNATSNLFREILTVDGNGKVSMPSGPIDMPIISKTKIKKLTALYGEEQS